MSATDQPVAPLRSRSSPDQQVLNSTLIKASFVGALGGLLFGFNTAAIAARSGAPRDRRISLRTLRLRGK